MVLGLTGLCRSFSQISISDAASKTAPPGLIASIASTKLSARIQPIQIETPTTLNITLKEIFDIPIINNWVDNPLTPSGIQEDPLKPFVSEISDPRSKTTDSDGIQAARLIIIRRKKMKKHKLKKLRKKMKFEWAKVRQRREMRKEKAFQAELIGQIKVAEQFSAEKYVEEKIRQATEVQIPRFWKGKRLPQFIIKEKLGIK